MPIWLDIVQDFQTAQQIVGTVIRERQPVSFGVDQSILCREGIIQFIQLCLFCGDFMVGCHGFCVSLSKLTLLAATIIKNKTAIFSTKATKTAVFEVSSVSVELQESLQFHTCGEYSRLSAGPYSSTSPF